MSIRINPNTVSTPRTLLEQKPSGVSTPPAGVQGPSASVPANGVRSSGFQTKTEAVNLQGTSSAWTQDSVQRQLAVSSTYTRLMEDAVTARALNALRVRDGAALAALGSLLTSGKFSLWPDKQAALEKLQQTQPELFTQLVTLAQQLGSSAPLPVVSTPDVAATQAANALTTARNAYTHARDVVSVLDQQLAAGLDALGPALTGAQKQAYIEAFRAAHQADYDRALQTEATLAASLLNPELDKMLGRDLHLAYASAEAAQALAGGAHSVDVLQWAARVLNEANVAQDMFEQTQTGVSIPGWKGTSELHAPVDFAELQRLALGGAAGELLAQANGDPQAALANFSALASAVGGDPAKTNELLSALNKASAGDYSGLSQLLNSADPFTQGLGTAAAVFAGLNARNATQQAAYGKFLKDLAATPAGAKVLGDALHSLAGASLAAAEGSAVPAQIAPTLSALTTALDSGTQTLDLFSASSFDDGAQQALTDLSALADSGAPAAAPQPETLTESITDLITDLGEELTELKSSQSAEEEKRTEREEKSRDDEVRQKEAREEETRELLEKVGVERNLAKTLAKGVELPKALSKKVGLTPAQIASLAVSHPEVFASARAAQHAVEFAQACGMRGDNVRKFFDALAQDSANYLQKLSQEGAALKEKDAEMRALVERSFPKARALLREAERAAA
ncbi:hypothetical protein D187_001324 [Cystobacter fuscus DSM 2262]|uniref:Uncharacterized protein n=1 Tax=Cystobacter fuscus (strain ATCC 25194 / DSM 2262 / NBRC 100088 / M29) TaxID=1242864 RepID=S9P8C5_CYSF2|nr:hypothetical protein [Cystobacter fuscus]EPX60675.1 hypothetical protein D187_001324 [Cystobacter fuscus DSM 2262]